MVFTVHPGLVLSVGLCCVLSAQSYMTSLHPRCVPIKGDHDGSHECVIEVLGVLP